MIFGKDLRNRWIVCLADGRKVGEIKDVYLDAEASKVMAVLTGKEGLLKPKAVGLNRSSIQVFGADVWLIPAGGRMVHLDDVPQFETFILLGDLQGREVQTDSGTKIGTIGDVVLDREAQVVGFTLSRVFVPGPLQEKKSLARLAVVNLGDKKTPVIASLARAEALNLPD
jgi:sporulation protein YlmC with PRC-barrel domain